MLLNGTYFYYIRKVRQGGRLYLSNSENIIPYFSTLLAKIDNTGPSLIITDMSTKISNTEIDILKNIDIMI